MDEDILKQLTAREQAGLHLLQAQYGNLIRYVVRGILKDNRDVEECVNGIYLRVWDKIGQYDPEKGRLSTWLTAVARNAALNQRQVRDVETEPLESSATAMPSAEEEVLRRERAQRLRSAVLTLPLKERMLCYRKYYYFQSTAQIAAELGMTERAVEGRLYRLRQRLRRELGGELL